MQTNGLQHVECEHANCRNDAVLRYRVRGELANLCRQHYEMHTLQEARAFTAANGLKSGAQIRAWIKDMDLQTPPSKKWAHRLKAKHADTDLLPIQIQLYQAVLGRSAEEEIEELAA